VRKIVSANRVEVHRPATVKDVMTTPVVTVNCEDGFRTIVRTLEQHRVSAVPVVDSEGLVVGIVSEGDLLIKEAEPMPSKAVLFEGKQRRLEKAKAMGRSAKEVMTAPVVTIEPEATLAQAAHLMLGKRVKRLPVIDQHGQLAGIVSRGDILKVFLRSDSEIRAEVVDQLIAQTLGQAAVKVDVSVHDGVVSLSGVVDRRSEIRMLARAVFQVDGVVGVHDALDFRHDDTGPPAIPAPWLGPFERIEIGDLVDAYRIEQPLGEGAFSAAYLARSVGDGQKVVIKSLCPGVMGDRSAHARFRREVEIMKRLSHPNIQRSLDTGESRSQPYIVLEFVEGEDFWQYLRRKGPLPPEEAVRYTMQLVDALEHMHAQGVVHRDLKPENLVRMPDGQLKLIDFGLAYMQGGRRLTWPWLSHALGSPGYMAPEQIQGKRGDRRADVYSLGILLYQMLSGRNPWSGNNPLAIMSQQLHTVASPVRRFAPAVPLPLNAITSKMIRWRRQERYQTVADLRRDLEHWEDLDLARFTLPDERPPTAEPRNARPSWLAIAAGAALFLAGSGLGALVASLMQR
jgi:serine/threonine-protein kinase